MRDFSKLHLPRVLESSAPSPSFARNPLLKEELEWFFTQSESDIGIRSNFGHLMDRAQSGSSAGSDRSIEARMEAAHAEGIIRRHLHAMRRITLAFSSPPLSLVPGRRGSRPSSAR